jgi:predicted ATP-dependent serine protease
MPEEYVCEDCSYTSIEGGKCPFCGTKMIMIDDNMDKDLAETDQRYNAAQLSKAEEEGDLDEIMPKGKKADEEDDEEYGAMPLKKAA